MHYHHQFGVLVPFVKKHLRVLILAIAGIFILSQFTWLVSLVRAGGDDETIVITGDTTTVGGGPGWLFNADPTTATPFEFNYDESSIGDGSLEVTPIGSNPADKFIGALVVQDDLDMFEEIKYDFKIGGDGAASDAVHFYINVYTWFDSTPDFYDCRFDYVPSDNGDTDWRTFEVDFGDDANNVAEKVASTCPDSPADMPDGSQLYFLAINVGDTSANDEGLGGYVDKVVVKTDEEDGDKKTTYDFEPFSYVEDGKIRICHATGSESNPYNNNKVSVNAIENAHGVHQDTEDIVPPYPDEPDGRNWTTENIALWEDNCGEKQVDCDWENNRTGAPVSQNDCFDAVVSIDPCGTINGTLTGSVTNKPEWNFNVYWSETQPSGTAADWFANANTFPHSFPEDYNGGSVTIWWWVQGTENGALAGSDVPSRPGNSNTDFTGGEMMVINTDCGEVLGEDCEPGPGWVSEHSNVNQALRKNGTAVLAERSNPDNALGAPDSAFLSLGFGGSIVVEFNGFVADELGDDVTFTETTNGAYPQEIANIEVSQDGSTWFSVGSVNNTGDSGVDINSTGLGWIKFVRVTDASIVNLFESTADGYDLNAVGANIVCEEPEPETLTVTLCKFDEQENALPGWTLMLLGEKVDEVVVPTNNQAGIDTSVVLDDGKTYVAIGEGIWHNSGPGANFVDAEYSTMSNWTTQMDGFDGYSTDILELQINSIFDPGSAWGAYNSAHRYAQGFTVAADGPANFRVYDGHPVPTVVPSWYGDNFGQLDVTVYEGYVGTTDETGCVAFDDVPQGDYVVDEIMLDGWENVSGLGEVTIEKDTKLYVVNRLIQEESETFTLNAQKVLCETESALPNWGDGGPDVHSTTAIDWVNASEGVCVLVQWDFEWSPDGVGNPGDNFGEQGGAWTKFSGSTELPITAVGNGSKVWVREVWNDDYIEFTGEGTVEDVSAELACNTDVLNYDNWEWIQNPQADQTYYCVAWNVWADGQIQGQVYEDETNNTIKNVDAPLENWTVWLLTHNSPYTIYAVDLTDVNGAFSFDNLPFGTYYVCQDLQEGWTQVELPANTGGVEGGAGLVGTMLEIDDALVEQFCYEVEISQDQPISLANDFGNFQTLLGETDTTNPGDDGEVLADEDGEVLADTGSPATLAIVAGLTMLLGAVAVTRATKKQ